MRNLLSGLMAVLVFSCLFAWGPSEYESHDFQSFFSLPEVRQEINPQSVNFALLNAAIFYETNRQRVLHGLEPFKYSAALEKAAFEHSKDMASLNFFSHVSPVSGKERMTQRLALVGISKTFCAENILENYLMNHPAGTPYQIRGDGYYFQGKKIRNRTYLELAQVFLTQWMNSPGHRRNILDPRGIYLGCGAALYGNQQNPRFKATQNFSAKEGSLVKIQY